MIRARWSSLVRLLSGSRRLLLASLALSILQSALLVPIALLIRHAFDTAIPDGDGSALVGLGAAILGLYLTSAAVGLATRYMSLRVTKDAITRLRGALIEKLYTLPRAYFDRRHLAELHSIIVQDTERLDVMCNALVALLLPAAVIAAALSILLLTLNPLLFAVLCCVVPVLFAISRILGRAVRERTRTWQRSFDRFSSQTSFALRAMTLTKLHGADRLEVAVRRMQFEELGQAGRTMAWMQSAYTLLNGAVAAAAGVIALVVGGRAVAAGTMTVGDLVSFFAAMALVRGQLTTVLATIPQVIAGSESMARLEELLDTEMSEPYAGSRAIEYRGAVAMEAVHFSYGRGSVLRGVTLRIDPGEQVALIGPNGAGKSTVIALMLGLYRPERGRVVADGMPLEDLELRAFRRRIGVVPQDPIIFPGTVAENIAYGRPDASASEIRRAAGLAAADRFIAALPHGYDTDVGDEGALLSGGQRQRVAIARAMLADPALLILDEPTTYLDEEAAGRLAESLRGPTVLLVSHDEAVARRAGRVCRLVGGRIVTEEQRPAGGLLAASS